MSSPNGPDLRNAGWRKSRRRMNNGNCVEVFSSSQCIYVRDSAKPDVPIVAFSPQAWKAFIVEVGER